MNMDMESHYDSLGSSNVMSTIDDDRGKQNDDLKRDSLQEAHMNMRMNSLSDEREDLSEQILSSGVEKIRSRRIDYKEKDTVFYAVRFLFECGYKLKCSPETTAAATALFHRFVKECDSSSYDKYLVASTTLYIAGKAYDEKYKIRDVINVSYNTLNRGSSPLDLCDDYWMRRDAIVQAELLLMRVFSFNVTYDHPHKYLLHYFMTLKTWIPQSIWDSVPIIQASYGFLQDFHHDPSVIQYQPQHLALACIQLAMLCYGVELPNFVESEHKLWYHAFCPELRDEKLSAVIDSIIDVYTSEPTAVTD